MSLFEASPMNPKPTFSRSSSSSNSSNDCYNYKSEIAMKDANENDVRGTFHFSIENDDDLSNVANGSLSIIENSLNYVINEEINTHREKSASPSMTPFDHPSHARDRMTSKSMMIVSSSPKKNSILNKEKELEENKNNNIFKKINKKKNARNKSKSNADIIGNSPKKNATFAAPNMETPLLQSSELNKVKEIPKYLIINLMIPNNVSNNGIQIILYGKLYNMNNKSCVTLMDKFVNCYDNRHRNNFKCCARIMNLNSTGFNFVTKKLIKNSNGNKFLIPSDVCLFEWNKYMNYFAIDIDLYNLDSAFAKKMLNYILPES